jgi:cytochrome d ubiquinol oxidase subunit II
LVPTAIAYAQDRQLFDAFFAPAALGSVACAIALGSVVMFALARRHYFAARAAVGLEALAVLAGWFGAQAPALVPGRYTYVQAASSDAMIVAILIAAGVGTLLLVPSMLLLFAVFKGPRSMPSSEGPR